MCSNRYPADPGALYREYFEEISGPDELEVGSPRGARKTLYLCRCSNLLRRYPLPGEISAGDSVSP
jgi:hypothetical protein